MTNIHNPITIFSVENPKKNSTYRIASQKKEIQQNVVSNDPIVSAMVLARRPYLMRDDKPI